MGVAPDRYSISYCGTKRVEKGGGEIELIKVLEMSCFNVVEDVRYNEA